MANYVFPKVDLPKVGRSNFNLDKSLMLSFAPGTIRCLYAKDVLPKDHWEIDMQASIESMPMVAPLYGKWKARWSWFFEPYSNIYGWMDNNTRRTTEEIIKTNLLTYALSSYVEYDSYIFLRNGDSASLVKASTHHEYPNTNPPANLAYSTHSLEEFNHWLGVASSSIWEDLGWPAGWNGYWIGLAGDTFTDYYGVTTVGVHPETGPGGLVIGTKPGFQSLDRVSEDYQSIMPNLPSNYLRTSETLHAIKPFGYLDIIRNYYVNPNFGSVPFVRKDEITDQSHSIVSDSNLFNSIGIVEQEVLDYIFKFLRNLPPEDYMNHYGDTLKWGTIPSIFDQNPPHPNSSEVELHNKAVTFLKDWCYAYCTENGGCFLSSYQMDLNKGLMNADTGNYKSEIQVQNNKFSMDTFLVQSKLYDLINILDLGRGRFASWLNALWCVDIKGELDRPIYLGSHSEVIGTTDIIANTSVPQGSTAGQQTGFSAGMTKKHRKISFNSDQYGVIYCIFEFVPYVSYSRGFKREDLKTHFLDIYNPRMAQLGYQDVPQSVLDAFCDVHSVKYFLNESVPVGSLYNQDLVNHYARNIYMEAGIFNNEIMGNELPVYVDISKYMTAQFTDDSLPNKVVVGRQVAWAEYMSDVDECRGDFALGNSLENWVLSRSYHYTTRRYESLVAGDEGEIIAASVMDIDNTDFSTYLHPGEYNSLFVDTSHDAQNFRQFVKFNVFVKRAIPSRTLPHL